MFGKKNTNSQKTTKSYRNEKSRDDKNMYYNRKKDESDGLSTYRQMLRGGLIDPNA